MSCSFYRCISNQVNDVGFVNKRHAEATSTLLTNEQRASFNGKRNVERRNFHGK